MGVQKGARMDVGEREMRSLPLQGKGSDLEAKRSINDVERPSWVWSLAKAGSLHCSLASLLQGLVSPTPKAAERGIPTYPSLAEHTLCPPRAGL